MKSFVIVDLEWTSWKNNLKKNLREKWQKKEIIQIGAIKVNNKYKVINKINIYVKPKFNPILSDYIKKLTHITQNRIDKNGLTFEKACKKFNSFTKNCKIISNGVDGKVFKENLKYYKLKRKVKIKNIRPLFINKYKIPKKFCNSYLIHTFFGYKLSKNQSHNALWDCKCILKALRKLNFKFN
jgi:inhibitor of KinA sporulation pathway (predicted exonuclease)|tara:strand:+ start:1526 stop:2074 length:549 start_codon:yes stop_codon:yes gene_type:complete